MEGIVCQMKGPAQVDKTRRRQDQDLDCGHPGCESAVVVVGSF